MRADRLKDCFEAVQGTKWHSVLASPHNQGLVCGQLLGSHVLRWRLHVAAAASGKRLRRSRRTCRSCCCCCCRQRGQHLHCRWKQELLPEKRCGLFGCCELLHVGPGTLKLHARCSPVAPGTIVLQGLFVLLREDNALCSKVGLDLLVCGRCKGKQVCQRPQGMSF